ncbi:hypothetical protein KR222_003561 [Zaprionus bogoriensis]|nr:hypothetical protein KR222_003561 [Zaprionus bogoriensis]
MICWGDRNCCGVFVDRDANDKCDCLRDFCIRDYAPEDRIMVTEEQLEVVMDSLYIRYEEHLMELRNMLKLRNIPQTMDYMMENKQIVDRLAQRLIELNFDVELVEVKINDDDPGHWVIFADYFATPAKNVVLIYGHIDVPAVDGPADGWKHDPYWLTEEHENLYGLGLTCSKGPVVCWIQAIEAWFLKTDDLPVNLRFIIDSDHTADIIILRKLLENRKEFFEGVDLMLDITNMWIAENVPILTISHSGYVNFELVVESPETKEEDCDHDKVKPDAKSTTKTREPMSEMCQLMNTLVNTKGINVDGLLRHVLPVTQFDWDVLNQAEDGIMHFKENYGASHLPHEQSQAEFLKHRWCMPNLTMHSLSMKQTHSYRDFLPVNKVASTFSVKLVPDQSIDYVQYRVFDHLDQAYRRFKCTNTATLHVTDKLKPLNQARYASYVLSARRAYELVYEVLALIPDTIHVCMPILNELRRHAAPTVQVLGLPFCSIHMKPYQVDEHMSFKEFQNAQMLFAAMLFEVALVPPECKCSVIPSFCFKKGKTKDRDFIRQTEPRTYIVSHVLYELNELAIDRTPDVKDALPGAKRILLGSEEAATLD